MTHLSQRMQLQRDALAIVNAAEWTEPLFGLAKAALSRWMVANSVPPQARIAVLLLRISRELGFLATRSQDAVENSESTMARTVEALIGQLADALAEFAAGRQRVEAAERSDSEVAGPDDAGDAAQQRLAPDESRGSAAGSRR